MRLRLQCANGSYYTGNTSDLHRRLWEHKTGTDRKAYAFSRRPVALVWCGQVYTKEGALRLEHQIKGWNRKKKMALIEGDFETIHQIVIEERRRR